MTGVVEGGGQVSQPTSQPAKQYPKQPSRDETGRAWLPWLLPSSRLALLHRLLADREGVSGSCLASSVDDGRHGMRRRPAKGPK
jgi:hypothetical protein